MIFATLLLTGLYAAPALAKSKINLYWGQNGNTRLADVCSADGVDFVTITFVYQSPENSGNTGYPGTEFGAHCAGTTYTVNGESSELLSDCTEIKEDISKCQAMGTKVLLSIGGQYDANANYTVSTVEKGQEFADFMWYAFGPYDPSWTGPRPFDLNETHRNSVDGFDFDVEKKFADQSPWIAMIERLREYYGDSGKYLITGAPECPLSDAWFKMKQTIVAATFDILFIQFYNNGGCDAVGDGFNFDDWTAFLTGTKSAHAQLYIGLLSYPGDGYVEPSGLKALIDVYGTRPNFGGISLWDEYFAVRTTDNTTGETYLEAVKEALATVTPTATLTSSIPTGTPTCGNPYTVQEGEYCYAIADKYVITVDQILAQNPDLDSFCDVVPDEVICLPATATTTRSDTPTPTPACAQYYTVQPSDYCYKIADAFGITYAELVYLNPQLDSNCDLLIGDVVCVKPAATSGSSGASQITPTATSTPSATSTSVPVCTEQYTVQAGDYCYKIATASGISVPQLQSYNTWLDSNCDLNPGEVLCVAMGSTSSATTTTTIVTTTSASASATATSSPSCAISYTVQAGDYCYKIATSYGLSVPELELLNPSLDADCDLRIGDILCVAKQTSISTSTTTSYSTITSPPVSVGTGGSTFLTLTSVQSGWNATVSQNSSVSTVARQLRARL